MSTDEATPLPGKVVGENVKRLRMARGKTQAELARLLDALGLGWPRSTLSTLETGRRADVTFSELVFLATALEVPLAELFAGTGEMRLADGLGLPSPEARRLLSGGSAPPTLVWSTGTGGPADWLLERPEHAAPVDADHALARRLGVDPDVVVAAARSLWGRTMTEERNRLTTPRTTGDVAMSALQAIRGHVTRDLEHQITDHLDRVKPNRKGSKP